MSNFSFIKNWILVVSLFLGFQLCTFSSCKDENNAVQARQLAIDTLSRNAIKALRPELDSICRTKKDSMVLSLKDSIYQARKKAIEEKLRKLGKQSKLN